MGAPIPPPPIPTLSPWRPTLPPPTSHRAAGAPPLCSSQSQSVGVYSQAFSSEVAGRTREGRRGLNEVLECLVPGPVLNQCSVQPRPFRMELVRRFPAEARESSGVSPWAIFQIAGGHCFGDCVPLKQQVKVRPLYSLARKLKEHSPAPLGMLTPVREA